MITNVLPRSFMNHSVYMKFTKCMIRKLFNVRFRDGSCIVVNDFKVRSYGKNGSMGWGYISTSLYVLYWSITLKFLCLSWSTFRLVLWHCWLGVRKSIRPVKTLSDQLLAWLSVWGEVQMICIWSSWCHCDPVISSLIKVQIGLTFMVPA